MRCCIAAASALAAGAAAVPGALAAEEGVAAFLTRHWDHPLPVQGPPPADFTQLEASFDPAACGTCHDQRLRQWRASRHARAMGPGVLGQLRAMPPRQAESCLPCHAPLGEQRRSLARALAWPRAEGARPLPGYAPADLHRRGLACPACHVRRHTRYGPPRQASLPAAKAPHGGFEAQPAYRDSRFCRSCHQFEPGGRRLNGKLLENTYVQWRRSRYAARGVSCQDCHMPEQSHRWPGIHDPEMVRQAVAGRLRIRRGETRLHLQGTVTNAGAGHKLPTYLTAQLWAELVLLDGEQAVATLARQAIGWKADLALRQEAFDTRLAPGETISVTASLDPARARGRRAALRLSVAPQEFYERFFAARLDDRSLPARARTELGRALDEARATRFALTLDTAALAPNDGR
jgi:hypothetical protein